MLTAHAEATHLMFGHQSQCEIGGVKRISRHLSEIYPIWNVPAGLRS
jgi:hypothetical protein